MVGHYLAMDPGIVAKPVPGIETREPAFGLPALWITEADKERAEMAGYTVVEPVSVIVTHLTEVSGDMQLNSLAGRILRILLKT